jgi:fibronectin type III domain protein/List-Bact-rpt repeat protein
VFVHTNLRESKWKSLTPIRAIAAKLVSFLLFILTAHCADVSLSWKANTESDLAGYRLHWGKTSGSPTQDRDVGNVTTGTITGLEAGVRYFITVTAYNTSRLESRPSNEVSYTPPTLIRQTTSKLTVINGSGSNVYPIGSVVKVNANKPPQGMVFEMWMRDTEILNNFQKAKTTALIPSTDVTIEATYKSR